MSRWPPLSPTVRSSVSGSRDLLSRLGIGEDGVFETLMVAEIFHKNTVFLDVLQLKLRRMDAGTS